MTKSSDPPPFLRGVLSPVVTPFKPNLDVDEKRFIAHILDKSQGNLCKAADLLGMHRNTLSRKISEYRLRKSA